ncbi:MAG TPA: hypothetical protein DDY14_09675 [Chromatiaceae bacterium]|nr:hypothetical protein [Chromatiaceae bacterium]
MGEFDIDEARCHADTLAFLQGMIHDGLVQAPSPTPASCPDAERECRSEFSAWIGRCENLMGADRSSHS